MHIAVDGSFWGGEERGVAVATRRLWSAVLAQPSSAQVTIFAPETVTSSMPGALAVNVGPLHGLSKLLWQQFRLPYFLRDLAPDLLHCPCYTVPLATRCRFIVTIHDLIAWTHPGLAGWRNSLHFRMLVGPGARRAAAVCVPTECVRQAVVNHFSIAAKRVFVVPWGVDMDFSPLPPDDARRRVREQFDVDEPFNLFCGCLEAKKNLPAAIQASSESGRLLLVVGPRVPAYPVLRHDSNHRCLGYVSTPDLRALYSAATALVFPSFVEGFGLPAIEAMSCGCPVITSTDPVLMEVCGGAAVHVPPEDANGLSASLRAVVADQALRESLVGRGMERAAIFKWATSVDRFNEALNYANKSSRGS